MIFAPVPTNNSLWHYCMARDWEDVHVVTRPEELLRAMRAGKVEIILASSLNGLARSSLELVALLKEFVSQKITLIIPSAAIDTSKMSGKAFLDVLAAIEEFRGRAQPKTFVKVWPQREREGPGLDARDCQRAP